MNKQLRTLGIMAGVFIVGLIVLFVQKKFKESSEEKERQSKLLISIPKEEVGEILLKGVENSPGEIHLVKKGGDWHLTKPVEDLAHDTIIESILNTLTSTTVERVVEEKPKNLATYALKDPTLAISVRRNAQEPYQTASIGKDTPVGFSLYALSSEIPGVLKTSRSFRNAIAKDFQTIRNRKLFPKLDRFEVQEMEIEFGGKTVALKRDGKSDWVLSKENIPAEKNEANRALNAVIDLAGSEVVSETGKDAANFGLTNPIIKVFLTKEDKTRYILRIGEKGKKVYAKREDKPLIYEIRESFKEKVEQPSAKYRSLALATFNRFKVNRVVLKRKDSIEEFKKEKETWSFVQKPDLKIDSAKMESFLTKLQDIKIKRYLPAGKKVNPGLVIQLMLDEEEERAKKLELQLELKGNVALGHRDGLALPFEIKKEDFVRIDLNHQAFQLKESKKGASKTKG